MTDLPTHVIPTEAASLPRVVLADANVFFSPRLRDLFMTLHAHDLLMLRWTRKIEEEWTRNVIKKHAGATAALHACVQGMRKCRRKLKQPPLAVLEYANALRNVGCLALPMALLRRAGFSAEGLQREAPSAIDLE